MKHGEVTDSSAQIDGIGYSNNKDSLLLKASD